MKVVHSEIFEIEELINQIVGGKGISMGSIA